MTAVNPNADALLHDDPSPFAVEALAVGDGHVLHVAQSGTPGARTALVLHGGPGSGCSPLLRRFFDPARWRIVSVDQRGAGRSTPRGGTAANATPQLLADLRRLRDHLAIDRWVVVGGSWGATLAVAHAADLPDAVEALLLRASFLARPQDVAAFFAGGPSLEVLAAALQSSDAAARDDAARAWWRHEAGRSGAPAAPEPAGAALAALVDRYRVQAHYLQHGCWLRAPTLLDLAARVPPRPTLLLHGTADTVCPPDGARALRDAMPHAALRWIDGAGHDPSHPAMAVAMRDALARCADTGGFA